MESIYNRIIENLGSFLDESYEEGFIILFDEKAPEDYLEFCVIHSGEELKEKIQQGYFLQLGIENYKITAVGNVVDENLSQLGHITLKFDGAKEAEKPGMLHLEKKEMVKLNIGDNLNIYKL